MAAFCYGPKFLLKYLIQKVKEHENRFPATQSSRGALAVLKFVSWKNVVMIKRSRS